MNWLDKLDNDIVETIEKYETNRALLTDEDIKEIMPECIKHYNSRAEGVFSLDAYGKTGAILYIKIPKQFLGEDGKTILNQPKKVKSNYGNEDKYLRFCLYISGGDNGIKSISVFATEALWTQMGAWDAKAFIKVPSLRMQYKKLGEDDKIKPVKLNKFLQMYGLTSLDQMDETDYKIHYSCNIQQVIK